MLCIYNTSTDPYFNLAAEEYLFSTSADDIFMLWQNEPSVIIGKHQDVWSEINMALANEQRIKIARRFSGGGAVYHDLGNLNLTFIQNNTCPDFTVFTGQIIDFLSTFGINAVPDVRQGLTVNNLKISGSAQYIRKGRIIHHATLLFSSDLDVLNKILDVPEKQINTGKQHKYSVSSLKSEVTKLSTFLPSYWSINEVKKKAINYFGGNSKTSTIYSFNKNDLINIERLRDEKYAKTSWNINP